MRTIEQMVQQEVMCCMSSLVATLANGGHDTMSLLDVRGRKSIQDGQRQLGDLLEQAYELCAPIPDYEEAAIQAGWKHDPQTDQIYRDADDDKITYDHADWIEACAYEGIEPYDREVFEHWAVTQWFADKLVAAGEKVDTDFGGLNVWARTCSGQGIASDGVVERIYKAMTTA